MTMNPGPLPCDGCGQPASPDHIAQRLQRLEWATRYRPIHIATLFLGAFAPEPDADFLYAPGGAFAGEAAVVLRQAGITARDKSPEAVLTEFQRGGFFLAHALECPIENSVTEDATASLLAKRMPSVVARLRRSLKPKTLVLMSPSLRPIFDELQMQIGAVGCDVLRTSSAV
jgi:hypothetical protein